MKTSPLVRILPFVVVAAFCAVSTSAYAVSNSEAAATVRTFKKKDPGIKSFFGTSYAYAVFPTVGKGGIGIGGAFGKGIVYHRGRRIGTAKLTQISIGFQLGGQAYSEILFFQNAATFKRFTNGNLKLGAGVSAVAITAGAAARTSFSHGVAVFTLAKGGLMYEASISGQSFEFTRD
jgi:lipid-binding SYLF domain-containing protein